MEKVISLLFDIERKANTILERANIEKAELSKETEQAIKELEDAISQETAQKIQLLEKQSVDQLEEEKKKMLADYHQQLQVLETEFNTNREQQVQKLFHEIIHI